MLEAGQFDELIELALRGRALPDDDELTRRDDEYQRLQFRLKAALRACRFVDTHGLETRQTRDFTTIAVKSERISARRQAGRSRKPRLQSSSDRRRFARVFAGLDPTASADMIEVLRRNRAANNIYDWEGLTAEAMHRTQAGREAEFLAAMQAADEISLYRLATIFEVMPVEWHGRAAVRPALQKMVRDVVRRDCNRISASN